MDMIHYGVIRESTRPLDLHQSFLSYQSASLTDQSSTGLGERGHLKYNDILEDFVTKLFKELSFSHPAS